MKLAKLVIIVLIFFLLYYPPITNFNTLLIVGVFSWLIIFLRFDLISKYINLINVFKINFSLSVLTLYLFFVISYNGFSLENLFNFLYWIIIIIPTGILISSFMKQLKLNEYDLLKSIIIAAVVQGFLAIFTFIFKSVQMFFVNVMVENGLNPHLIDLSAQRIYGFSSSLTFATPIFQSMLAVICIYIGIKRSTKYLFAVPILLFSAIINARTSIVIFISGIALIIIFEIGTNLKNNIKILFIVFLGLLGFYLSTDLIKLLSPQTFKFIDDGIFEIIEFFNNEITRGSYFSYITNRDVFTFPDGISLIFGKGTSDLSEFNLQSDVGWVYDIWFGGLIYAIFIYVIFINFSKIIFLNNHKIFKFIAIYFLITMAASNIKGYAFGVNEVTTFVIILIGYFYMTKHVNFYKKRSK